MLAVQILLFLVPALYGVAFALTLVHFVKRFKRQCRPGLLVQTAGALCHFGLIFHLGRFHGHMPLTTVWEAWSIIALCLVVIDIYMQLQARMAGISVFTLGAVLLFQLVASIGLTPSFESNPVLRGGWFVLHSTATIGGYTAFALSALLAGLHLLQRRQIRRRKLGFIHSRLPSLVVLDRLSGHAALTGLLLLSIGIAAGMIFADQVWGTYWSWDPKQISVAVVWLVYAIYAMLRLGAGWSGPRLAVVSLVGLISFAFTALGVHLVFSTMHNFL